MAIPVTYAASGVTFGTTSWDNADGGPMRVVITQTQDLIHTHVAADYYDSDVAITKEITEVLVDLSEFVPTTLPTVNASNSLVLALKKSDGTDRTETLYRCKYVGLTTSEQTRDQPSQSVARFVYDAGGTEKDIWTA